ncbi:MAG: rhodanese-like domain-containing protein [Fusobacteriaceae bacterium]
MKQYSLDKQKALELIMDDATIIIDVRAGEELEDVPPITEDCYNVPMDEKFMDHMKELEEDEEILKDSKILVYSENGVRSMRALQALREAGYLQAYNLEGGINAIFEESC